MVDTYNTNKSVLPPLASVTLKVNSILELAGIVVVGLK